MKSNFSKRIIMFLIIFLACLLVTSGIGYLIFSSTRRLVVNNLGQSSVNLSASISRFIESDIDPYRQLNSVEDYATQEYDEDYYDHMLSLFQGLKVDTNATYIYTMKKLSENEFVYVLDAEIPGSETFSTIGTIEESWDELNAAFDLGIDNYSDLEYEILWGVTMLTAVSPIVDPISGDIIGAVGVDFTYDRIEPLILQIQTTVIVGVILFASILTLVLFNLFESRMEALEIDYLTNLFSKRYFDKHLRVSILNSKIRNLPLSIMMIDVDSFKNINDRFGHMTGDKILKVTADILKRSVRRSDICARYGGDEFSILLPDADQIQARIIGDRIVENLNEYDKSIDREEGITLSVSIGIAEWKSGTTMEELETQSDSAMYSSKRLGNNKITVFEAEKQ